MFERSKSEVVDFDCPYRVGVECLNECEIGLSGKKLGRSMN